MVILVDENDLPIGSMDKLEAHEKALLHRAFSVFIFNDAGELLMQQRAHHKYHSGGLWTNSCCSHPFPGEETLSAANRRLNEEMGLKCDLRFAFKFQYKAAFDNSLTEHEIDHVFIGESNILPIINSDEVSDFKYMAIDQIVADLKINSHHYTAWFQIIFAMFLEQISTQKNNASV
jgi:isopentenyl-diphosphate Delta-isomerase